MTGTEDPISFKEKGNTYFKNGKMVEAAEFYKKAEAADPTDPIYPSNLSAALYEAGRYPECLDSIERSFKSASDPALLLKLSTRLVKTLCHGVRGGSISSEKLTEKETVIETLPKSVREKYTGDSVKEHERLWEEWMLFFEAKDRTTVGIEAHHRMALLPILKKPIYPVLEYYSIGQDPIISLVDDWGAEYPYPLNVNTLPLDELPHLSFLFGGVGDARHLYGTLIGGHRAFKSLNSTKRKKLHMHMTAIDVHPGPLARDLCILMLLWTLTHSSSNDKIVCAEIKATIFYTFAGVVLPGYCHTRLRDTMADLKVRLTEQTPRLPAWLHVNPSSIAGIVDMLDYWMTAKKSTRLTLNEHNPGGTDTETFLDHPNVSSEYKDMFQSSISTQREQIGAVLDRMKDEDLRAIADLGESIQTRRRILTEHREVAIDLLLNMSGNLEGKMAEEVVWYEATKVFLPPPELWVRHPGFKKCRRAKGGVKSSPMLQKILNHIERTWKPNITFFGPELEREWNPLHRYPDLNLDAFHTPQQMEEFIDHFGLSPRDARQEATPDAPAFTHTSLFFDAVAHALKGLEGHLTLEFLCGELTQELAKMKHGVMDNRPAEFPTIYTRAWLSNIPDYAHGLMNIIVYALPNLQCEDYSAAASNCLLNSPAWKDSDEFCYNYTLLRPEDVPRYLGCRLNHKDAIMGIMVVGNNPLPRPASELASREELMTWLTRVLLYIIIPGTGGSTPIRVRLPNSLVAFVDLLAYLHTVGYPAHWLAEFLQCVLADGVVTDLAPYTGSWPIPISDIARRVPRRKVRLDPWHAELETIIAYAREALPFSLALPEGFATSHTDIGMYKSAVWMPMPIFGTTDPVIYDPVVCLLFYSPSVGNPDSVISQLPTLLDGRLQNPPSGKMVILTSVEAFSVPGEARWRLSNKRVRMMKKEGWLMVAYRTDRREAITHPVPALQWVKVTSH